MPRKAPSGPKEGSEFGYDPAADMRAKMRNLFDRDMDGRGDLKQIGKAVSAPTISSIRRRLLDASTEIRTDEPDELTFCHSVLCQTSLPSAKPKDGVLTWERRQGRATLLIEDGKVLQPKEGTFVQLGLPCEHSIA